MDSMDRPWFAAKRFGIGSGWPIVWQGWVALIVFLAAFVANMQFSPYRAKMWLAVILMVAFAVVTAAKTKGGWRWRWGRED